MQNEANQVTREIEPSASPARKRIYPFEEARACAERLRKEAAEVDLNEEFAKIGMDWQQAAEEIAARVAAMRNRGKP